MKHHACQLSFILAAALAAAPAAWAGAEIVKCVDRTGHVTLTDQPCGAGAATERLDSGAMAAPVVTGPAVEHYPAPRAMPRAAGGKKPEAKQMKFSRDVATLKEARAQLLLIDGGKGLPQPRLAGLN